MRAALVLLPLLLAVLLAVNGQDSELPSASISCNGEPCSSEAYDVPVTISFSCASSITCGTRYCIDSGNSCRPLVAYRSSSEPVIFAGGTSYVRYFANDADGNAEAIKVAAITVLAEEGDTMAPVMTRRRPSGILAAGTREAFLMIATDEPAECFYSPAQKADISRGIAFETRAGTAHTAVVTGLREGRVYRFFINCRDEYGNVNSEEAVIAFSVAPAAGSGVVVAGAVIAVFAGLAMLAFLITGSKRKH